MKLLRKASKIMKGQNLITANLIFATFIISSCNKKNIENLDDLVIVSRDCVLQKVVFGHPHSKVTEADYVIREVGNRSEKIVIANEVIEEAGLDTRNEEDIFVSKGDRFLLVAKVNFHQAGVGDFVFFKCIHVRSGSKCYYEYNSLGEIGDLFEAE